MFSVENEIKKACPVCDMDCPYFALGYCKLENPQEDARTMQYIGKVRRMNNG